MSLLELQNIQARYGQCEVIADVSLRFDSGERVVLMGASGAGKTTLLRVIAGLQQPVSGQVIFNGTPIAELQTHHRNISWLSQDYALYPQLNVQQNIAAALKQQGLSAAAIADRFEHVADWFGIEPLRERLPSQISGGQAQRVAFAKALARQPQLLLLDEPLSQVDRSLRSQLIDLLLPACEQLNTAICWVTHDPLEAFQVGSRISILNAGRIVQDGPAEVIYRAPSSRHVADLTSVLPINWLPLEAPEFTELRDGRSSKYLGVRPEDFSFLAGPGVSFDYKVESIRFLGFARLAQGRIGQASIQILDLEHRCVVGDSIRVFLNSAKVLRCFE